MVESFVRLSLPLSQKSTPVSSPLYKTQQEELSQQIVEHYSQEIIEAQEDQIEAQEDQIEEMQRIIERQQDIIHAQEPEQEEEEVTIQLEFQLEIFPKLT